MERSLYAGIGALRWAGWAWMATVLVLGRRSLDRPGLAFGLIGLALLVTIGVSLLITRGSPLLTHPGVIGAEVAVGFALLAADGHVYGAGHVMSTEPSLGVAWPLAGVIMAGAALGPLVGTLAGVSMGVARTLSTLPNLPAPPAGAELVAGELTAAGLVSLLSTAVLFVLAGAVSGYAVGLLRDAERQISVARAREEVARTLHDGVLQTLSIVERRADDPALVRLAREQERDLREFLFGRTAGGDADDLGAALRAVAGRFEVNYDTRVEVLVPDDLPPLQAAAVHGLAGAVREALTNAGKHGAARRAVVFVEPVGQQVFCSVRDDGVGFDPDQVDDGIGLSRSIRGRIGELAGRVEVDAHPGRGCEVRMWVPAG